MPGLGVAHRDIQPLNMNYNFKTKEVYLLDFSHAVVESATGQDAFQQACFEDLYEIDRLVNISKKEAFWQIHYYHWPDWAVQATCEY